MADGSYGVEVAKLAGLPDKVVRRARAILDQLEEEGPAPILLSSEQAVRIPEAQVPISEPGLYIMRERVRGLSVETMTPIEALNVLYELKKLIE